MTESQKAEATLRASAEAIEALQGEQLIKLVRETVVQLNILGDRLEHYASSHDTREGERDAGPAAASGE